MSSITKTIRLSGQAGGSIEDATRTVLVRVTTTISDIQSFPIAEVGTGRPVREALREGLKELGLDESGVHTLVVPHLHPDHVGMASRLVAERSGGSHKVHDHEIPTNMIMLRRSSDNHRWPRGRGSERCSVLLPRVPC